MRTRRERWWVAVVVVVALIAGSCGADGTRGAKRPSAARPCAWAVRADKETLNIAYPDTAATYWAVSYDLAPGQSLRLRGRFPSARYMSFISYGPVGGVVDVLTDHEIVPDPGSANPFVVTRGTARHGRDYTVTIRAGAPAAGNNVVWAGTTTVVPPTVATSRADPSLANRLGTGGVAGVHGTVLYRVYLSGRAGDPTGGTGLPTVSVVNADGRRTPVTTCATPGASTSARDTVQRYGPATDTPAPAEPTFVRPQSRAASLFPDPDNVYIATILHYVPGRVAVVEGRAPTFPDPTRGRVIGDGEQVRYWSLCTNEYRKPYPVTACVSDRDTVLDASGRYRYVISTPQDRPADATAAHGVTWIDWGSTKVDALLLLRHMLAAPDFPQSAIHVQPGAAATTSMGEYAPLGVYCTTGAFERGDRTCTPS